ncbi:hypothetical protein HMPREF0880_02433 [Yokenella regensburgei ATCC 43003]|nr:hypothetical protein HMPREF0880_02433 [Yokenella regensburgei ATCC 43003]
MTFACQEVITPASRRDIFYSRQVTPIAIKNNINYCIWPNWNNAPGTAFKLTQCANTKYV